MRNLFLMICAVSMSYGATFDGDGASPDYSLIIDPLPSQQSISLETVPLELPPVDRPRKNSVIAVGLSSLIPGLGHFYLGEMGTAGGLLGSAFFSASLITIPGSPTYVETTSLATFQATWFYGIYAAYRDVRKYNGQIGYSYKMPTDSLSELAYAPFRFSVLKKPEVWGGFLGAFALASTVAYFAFPNEAHIELKASTTSHFSSIAALPIGVGEESMFRGFLQSALLEFVPPWAGIALSSLSFGAAHIPNALVLNKEDRWRYYAFSLPLITGMGAYFGWITYKNRSLQESVAIHTWYDFVLLAASSLANHAAATGRPGFAIAIPF